jgi:hypothetical protein
VEVNSKTDHFHTVPQQYVVGRELTVSCGKETTRSNGLISKRRHSAYLRYLKYGRLSKLADVMSSRR